MVEAENRNQRTELTRLVRSIAREVAYEVLDEHLADYEHKTRKLSEAELEAAGA